MLHLEGLGLVGSAVAVELTKRGVPFTWHDTDMELVAWPACTGTIYPSGAERDQPGYAGWSRWRTEEPWRRFTETSDYWYCTKNAPHGAKVQPLVEFAGLRLHPQPSFHLNAQQFVPWAREEFAAHRVPAPPAGAEVLVTHGFNVRLKRYVWGWAGLVRLVSTLPRRFEPDTATRPCLYFRPNRVQMAYAYPVPGTDEWYAGSSLIPQTTAKPLTVSPKALTWHALFSKIAGDAVRIVDGPTALVQGWRPSTGSVADEAAEPYWKRIEDRLVVMPLWHSGVRWLPAVIDDLFVALNLEREAAVELPE